jgi:hypothetical protein
MQTIACGQVSHIVLSITVTCEQKIHEKNSCEFFTSQVKVFGYDIDESVVEGILKNVRDALPGSLAVASKSGAVRLELVDGLTKQVSGPDMDGAPSVSIKHAGSTAGLVLSILVILVSLGVLIFYCFIGMGKRSGKKLHGKKGRIRKDFLRYFDSNSLTNTYLASEIDEADEGPVLLVSTNPSRDRSSIISRMSGRICSQLEHESVLVSDSRPVIVEFGASFDPERDRYLKQLEEESSSPPKDGMHMAWSTDLSLREIQIV